MVNARQRTEDVEKLYSNVVQDFLKMVLQEGWQEQLYQVMEERKSNKNHFDSYKETYKKMRALGPENHSIDMLDVSIMKQMLLFDGFFICTKETREALTNIGDIRNGIDHSGKNENDDELYLEHMLNLRRIRSFVECVDYKEISIPDVERKFYLQKFTKRIDDLIGVLDAERIVLVQWKREIDALIQDTIDSKDEKAWLNVSVWYNEKLLDDLRITGDIKKYVDRYEYLYIKSSEAGITDAMPMAARYFIDNEIELDRVGDYLLRAYEGNSRNDAYLNIVIIEDISAYKSKFGSVPDSFLALVERMRKDGVPVEIANNGMYRIKKKPKMLASVEEIAKKTPPVHLPPNLKRILDDSNNKGHKEVLKISDKTPVDKRGFR